MTQQYMILKNENDLLNELKGMSFNQRTKTEAMRILDEIHQKADVGGSTKSLAWNVKDGMVKGVGGSSLMKNTRTGKIHSDLITNNFGLWLSRIMSGGTGPKNQNIIDTVPQAQTILIYDTSQTNLFNDGGANRMRLQIGSGTTPPARTDTDIETKFVTGSEANLFECSLPVWISGSGIFQTTGQIATAGSGTINESAMIAQWSNSGQVLFNSMLYHDIISPGVPFVTSDSIFLEYTTQL
jgi:hypothetical protein